MTIEKTKIGYNARVQGTGFVMYGKTSTGKWFQRWYPTIEAAKTFAAKKGWETKERVWA